ncbi:DUF4292 domain-containing protein [Ekhidna lutea]|uniref:DUF4292 domain-containing protein n=1 Tax=Ekhidna lutea TaxID=447679 RepID=UPI000B77B286|nr:DUF4292 domain-containing protein [Ekhidna lutea]
MNKLIIVCLMGMIGLSSCNRKVGAIFTKTDKLEVVDPQFEYLSAKARFKFDHEEKNVSATANFRIKKDSIIWISISGFGFEGARVLIDTSNVRILDKLKKQYYEYTFEELSKEYDFDFNFQMIQSVVLGNLVEPYKKQRVEKRDTYYTYSASKGVYLFQNYIGAKSMKLEKVQVFDEGTKNTISVNYSDFILVDGQIFPYEILALIDYEAESKPNTEISISYNKMVIEDAPISFPYTVPSKYERK